MRKILFLLIMLLSLSGIEISAKPHCEGFNNYNDKVTIVFSDSDVKFPYIVTDAVIKTYGKEYKATSIRITMKDGIAYVKLEFPYISRFSNPKVSVSINGRKSTFKVCN